MRRRGISLFFLLASLVVVSIFAFSTHRLAMQSLRQTRRLIDAQAATLLARSAVACVAGRLQEGLAAATSDLNKLLLDPDLATGTVLTVDTSPLARVAEAYREAGVTVEARLERVEGLDPTRLSATTGGFDAAERRLWVRIRAQAQVGPVTTQLTEIREMPVVHLLPGILGKFSLFVRQAESDPLAYNRYANSINGWADDAVPDADRSIPLVLKNGGELDEGTPDTGTDDLWMRRGFVYLGGGRTVLNLTAGNDEGYGENFHFYLAGSPPDIPGYYDPAPPPFFTRPPDFSRRHPQTLQTGSPFASAFAYCLKYVVSGFYTRDEQNQTMNVDDRLAVTFPGPPRPIDLRMRSSVLHLFGTRSNPSPTLVLGNVFRRYAEYAGVVVETTGNEVRDAILTYVRQTDKGLGALAPVPSTVDAAARGDVPAGTPVRFDPQELTWAALFGDEATYKAKMCRVIEEPYLRSHDFLLHKEPGIYEPTGSSFGGPGARAGLQQTFTLSLHPTSRQTSPFFDQGNLAGLPADLLRAKAVYRVPDLKVFRERFLGHEGRLRLDAAVIITGRPGEITALPAEVKIELGGIILLEHGHLALGNVVAGSDPDQLLTCVALEGNILLNPTRGGELAATLVALKGRVENQNPSRPLDLRGGLCVGEFPAAAFPRGGRLAWNPSTDPSGPDWGLYYRAFLSDCTLEVARE